MPRCVTPRPPPLVALSVRLPADTATYFRELADRQNRSLTAVLRRALEDVVSCYDLPPRILDSLKSDRRELGLSPIDVRPYIVYLLTERYTARLRRSA